MNAADACDHPLPSVVIPHQRHIYIPHPCFCYFQSQSNTQSVREALREGKRAASAASSSSSSSSGARARPIDAAEAKRGRVDVATVADWGSGAHAELGELRVKSIEARFDGAADAGAGPLSAQLARRLAQLEAGGALRLADGGRPLPPFERWSFAPRRYAAYLADATAAHAALEAALAAAAAGGHGGGDDAAGAAVGVSPGIRAALAQLGPGSGLHRGAELRADLEALLAAQPQLSGSGGGSNSSLAAPSGNSAALCRYVAQLGDAARSRAGSQPERDRAGLRLWACAYSLLASFQSLGARVGAAAAERSGAAAAGALRAYMHYPGLAARGGGGGSGGGGGRADPAAALVAAVNAAGEALTAAEREAVCDELARAFPKAALLVAPLAHED